jgi:hypothetical protein
MFKKKLFTAIVLSYIVAVVLFICWPLVQPLYARTVSIVSDKLGSFTGPVSGTAQDDNVKASLDLLHGRVYDLRGGSSTDGDVFYVDSAVASSGGTSWATAVGTLDAAIALCGTNHDDLVLVAPGHAENLSGADGVDVDIAGVTIIGLGQGDNRPTFTYTNAAGEFVIGADNVVVKNLRFTASVTAITTAINVESGSTDYVIEDCFFDVDIDGTDEFSDCITISTASCDGGIIRNNFFDSGVKSNAGPQSWINIVDGNDIQIIGNTMYGDCASACIQTETTDAYNLTIKDNLLVNGIIGGTAGLNTVECIELTAATSGMIIDNRLFCNVATQDLAIVGADMYLSGNTYNETEGSFLEAGKTYVISCNTTAAATTDNMWLVAGGSIEIISMFGESNAAGAGSPGTLTLELDSADNDFDSDLSTTVNVDALGDGDTIRFTNVIDEGVVDITANVAAGQPLSWYVSPGMIEQTLSSTGTLAITWYMTFRPLEPGVIVTTQ